VTWLRELAEMIAHRLFPAGSASTRPSNVGKVDRVLAEYRRMDGRMRVVVVRKR
jgi:hypothetical protein